MHVVGKEEEEDVAVVGVEMKIKEEGSTAMDAQGWWLNAHLKRNTSCPPSTTAPPSILSSKITYLNNATHNNKDYLIELKH